MNRVILASASPRRKELLAQIGICFDIIPAHKEEIITKQIPYEIVEELAAQKASEVWDTLAQEERAQRIVIGADTLVAYGNTIMGKPQDEADAKRMLQLIQGQTHQVYTGVSIIWDKGSYTFYECTNVSMYPMSEAEIEDYIRTGESMDKAGSYAIQGCCAAYIKGIEGDYNNVVGLPVGRVYQELKSRCY